MVAPSVVIDLTRPAGSPLGGSPTDRPGPTVATFPGHSSKLPPSPAVGVTPVASISWRDITGESPHAAPVEWFTEGTWDARDQYLVYYGGDNFAGTNLQSTVAFSHGAWTTLSTTGTSPGTLDGPALAYDAGDGYVVLYGGLTSYSPFSYTNLTYRYAAGVWSSAHLTPTPPPRLAGAMAWDADLNGTVLFGGYNNSDPTGATLLNDLWLYRGGSWSRLPDASPPAVRTWPSIAFDPIRHELVLYGGVTSSLTCLGDTWTYNGTWTHVLVPSGGPPGLAGTAVAFDSDLGQVVLTGGQACSTGVNNTATWSFNGTAWLSVAGAGTPHDHVYGVSAWDPVDQVLVVSGGETQKTYTDVLSTQLRIAHVTAPSTGEVGEPLAYAAQVAGGVPARNISWSWGDGTSASFGANVTHVYAQPGTYPVQLAAADLLGGSAWANLSTYVVKGLTPSIVLANPVVEVGVNDSFTGVAEGGVGPFAFNWSFGDGAFGVGPQAAHQYAAAGNRTVLLTVSDSVGVAANTTLRVDVLPRLVGHLAAAPTGEVGVGTTFGAVVQGGAPPINFSWASDDGGFGSSVAFEHAFASTGTHVVTLTLRDAAGAMLNLSVSQSINARVGLRIDGSTSVSAGSNGVWTANVTGGVAPYRVTWVFDTGESGNGTTASTTFSGAGTPVLEFFVNDSVHASATRNATISVSAAPAPFGGSIGGIPTLAIVGVALGVIAVVAAVLLGRRRRSA